MRAFVKSLGGLLVCAGSVAAQGTVSTQGFGYPAGGLSTRGEAGGGAFAEFDFLSLRNPSGLLGWGRGGLYFQYDPEFRSVHANGQTNNTLTARFPLAAAAIQVGSRTIVSVTSSTLLDRTFGTSVRSGQRLGPDSVSFTETLESSGAINDIRLGAGFSITPSLSVGAGIHAYAGENRLHLVRQFDDTARYGAIDRSLTLGYLGKGVSVGATWRPLRSLAVAASARHGGSLDLRAADTVIASARVPDRYGFGVRYDGLPGLSLAFSADHTNWSQMNGLGSAASLGHDSWEYDAGAEMTGPRMGALPALFYLGYRSRDLPFSVTSTAVSERVFSTGASVPISGPRAVFDVALQRALRGSVGDVRESAWIMSFGVSVRP